MMPLLILAVLVTMVAGALLAVWKFRVSDDSSGGAVGVVIAPCVMAIYLVAAAMGVVIGWDDFKAAEDGLIAETGAAQSLYWSTATFPGEEGEEVREKLRAYLTAVVEEDWPLMEEEGELSAEGDEALAELSASVRALSLADSGDGLDRLSARQEATALSEARIERADAAGDDIPPLVLVITAVTAVAVAVLPFAMIRKGSFTAYFWSSVNLVLVFATVLLIASMGNPFNGILANDMGAVEEALAAFDRADLAMAPQ
ncbi:MULTISPECIES: DUF4239 domain-containing protein [unclassified Nocardiopsis]|uniref:bestrophin-like domain n=1 Tax=unclassified Nocardiopsis TaxID=2649073 RepID=UPI00135BD67F|nr:MULTISPECIES: DUF4239 domain-containing protein [unclassified Nocardiopsis]